MPKSEPKPRSRTQQVKDQNPPPPGYPTNEDHPTPKKCCHRTTKKGDRGFIEGCCISEPKAQGRNCSCFASKTSEPKAQGRHCSCFASKTSEPKAQGTKGETVIVLHHKHQSQQYEGYPINEDHPTSKKGTRGFIKGCIFSLCCCWICEECF